ncbi:helix-turn-helix transcriptional regulator [Lysinibacillus sp. 1 U-2021]|uniref:helix-turn-helix transcriptional regulator n=1 Tax=Lysinibacillus sp. 1 U-2021 TaxID=3039426 RepID=UPI00248141F4|nr:helix-turn-helix transcriptional regulator [Lysinibacillus sp. 1 U-2021]WGT39038.1 helix-turn-helix transcriptional regulator [Lysinibacillus sp. 1 U-2021]
MSLTMGEKIKVLLHRKNMSVQDLAELLGQSRQNINTKLKKDNFSEQDLKKIAEVLEVEFEGFFFLKNGEKI